ncbi:MAG TPA: cation:proton antiporter [Patescibacteria group bacterium]|nr:cation:proton antiporter [Patescibacteria group bacterium]
MITTLFFILLAALIGGLIAKALKIPSLVGYILAGSIGGLIFSFDNSTSQNIAQIGVILLMFSVGLEISLEKLIKVGKIAIVGSILQIIIVTAILFFCLVTFANIAPAASLVLSLAFSMSSTALIVKILSDRQEEGTIHYEILTSWALVQDLAVIPIVVLLPTLTLQNNSWGSVALSSLLTTVLILGLVLLIGKLVAPYLTHLVAKTNNREFLLLLAIVLALGVASLVTLFGISASFGAFLAGVVISKTQENHAIFSETRPLRDIFVTLFFVSLGFLVSPIFVFTHFFTILILTVFIIFIKALVTFLLNLLFGVRGKTAIAVSIGIAQVGEFAFVLFLLAQALGILDSNLTQIAISTTLVTLLVSSVLFKELTPIWNFIKEKTKNSPIHKFFVGGTRQSEDNKPELKDHIILAGFGRMGKWIGKALKEIGVDFIIIDYNHKVIHEAKLKGDNALYGDASVPEMLEEAQVKNAKAVIISIPDPVAQEEIVAYCKKNYPDLKIMVRAHLDSDIKKLLDLKVQKVVQPEFEAAISIVKSILINSGRNKEEVNKKLKSLRLSHANM